jgi:hypothetical protein
MVPTKPTETTSPVQFWVANSNEKTPDELHIEYNEPLRHPIAAHCGILLYACTARPEQSSLLKTEYDQEASAEEEDSPLGKGTGDDENEGCGDGEKELEGA